MSVSAAREYVLWCGKFLVFDDITLSTHTRMHTPKRAKESELYIACATLIWCFEHGHD